MSAQFSAPYATPHDIDFSYEIAGVCSIYKGGNDSEYARLISAAPALLSALEMARALMVSVDGYEVSGPSIMVIDAAIAKATEAA